MENSFQQQRNLRDFRLNRNFQQNPSRLCSCSGGQRPFRELTPLRKRNCEGTRMFDQNLNTISNRNSTEHEDRHITLQNGNDRQGTVNKIVIIM
ncbi:hypothetical protein J2S21_001997 [Peribacillus cavernae]|nr:hypothetical protein [Peribacillus cavernae]